MNSLGFFQYALNTLEYYNTTINEQQEKWKKRILEEYKKTYKMPRKMKKQKRKELNFEWNLAHYNPFERV